MPRGGKRPGAGKPLGSKDKTTIRKEAFRAHYEAKMKERWDEICNATIDLCLGHLIADQTDESGNRMYMKSPSAEMNRYVGDQMMGKALQNIDMTSKGERVGGILSFEELRERLENARKGKN